MCFKVVDIKKTQRLFMKRKKQKYDVRLIGMQTTGWLEKAEFKTTQVNIIINL